MQLIAWHSCVFTVLVKSAVVGWPTGLGPTVAVSTFYYLLGLFIMLLRTDHSQLSVICTCGSTLARGMDGWMDGLKFGQVPDSEHV